MTPLSQKGAQDITRAANSMPYGGMVHGHFPITSEEGVARYLDTLAAVLRGVAARNEATESELRDLQRQRMAVRAFLGTDVLPDA